MTQDSLKQIVQTLQDAKVRYLVVGGLAVIAHGFVRLTVDVDLLIQLDESNIIAALLALENLGYRPTVPITPEQFAKMDNRRRWMDEKQMKVLKLQSDLHRETDIDVFVYDPIGFVDAHMRVDLQDLGPGLKIPICSYDDLVKLKQLAGRPRDLDDLAQLRKARGQT